MRKTQKVAYLGVLAVLALGFSYVEFLIPFEAIGIPGVKLGLANLVVMLALFTCGVWEAVTVSAVRILLTWLLFGNFTGFLYSLAGGALSLALMILLQKLAFFGEVGVSVAGGVAHNMGQLAVAVFLLRTAALWYYLPVLLIAGVVTGAVNGVLLRLVLPRIARLFQQ